jgi:transposase
MDARLRALEIENARWRTTVLDLRTTVLDLRATVELQRATIEKLTAALEAAQHKQQATQHALEATQRTLEVTQRALEAAQRAGKRQAAPFRKADAPAAAPKKPGRKKGRRHGRHEHRAIPAPEQIDERYHAPLPDRCPKCGGRHLEETHTACQYQTEIPRRPIHREFTIHFGRCQDCGRRVQGRHPLQTSDAVGAAASQLGSNAQAAFVLLNKGLGLSHGKCRRLFRDLFGVAIARATSIRSLLKSAARAEPAYHDLRQAVRNSDHVVPDETGWRVGGRNAWLHVFAAATATCYEIGDRSGDAAERLLGRDWSGTLIHDGWHAYDRFRQAFHQQCLGHLQRRCRELLETAVRGAARLPQQILALIDEAFALRRQWRGHRLSGDDLAEAGLELTARLERLVSGRFTDAANRRLAGHVRRHSASWFWFLTDPKTDATTWRAEQALRPAVVNRKVWGGNRTWWGAEAQAILTSLLATLRQRGHDALEWFSAAHRARIPQPLPP